MLLKCDFEYTVCVFLYVLAENDAKKQNKKNKEKYVDLFSFHFQKQKYTKFNTSIKILILLTGFNN
jgi:hypothetical protein